MEKQNQTRVFMTNILTKNQCKSRRNNAYKARLFPIFSPCRYSIPHLPCLKLSQSVPLYKQEKEQEVYILVKKIQHTFIIKSFVFIHHANRLNILT